MTAFDSDAYWRRVAEGMQNIAPKATRGDGLHLVPSQETERHQAVDPPQVWPSQREELPDGSWGVVVFIVLAAIVAGAWIAQS